MINLFSTTLIQRPIKQVFDFISTAGNDVQWQYGALASSQLSPTPIGLGTLFSSLGHFMGRRLQGKFEVTEYEPNKKYGFKSLSGPVHSTTSYTLEKDSGRTKLLVSIQASVPNFFHITEKLLWKTMKKQLEEDMAMLRTILEQNSSAFRPEPPDVQ